MTQYINTKDEPIDWLKDAVSTNVEVKFANIPQEKGLALLTEFAQTREDAGERIAVIAKEGSFELSPATPEFIRYFLTQEAGLAEGKDFTLADNMVLAAQEPTSFAKGDIIKVRDNAPQWVYSGSAYDEQSKQVRTLVPSDTIGTIVEITHDGTVITDKGYAYSPDMHKYLEHYVDPEVFGQEVQENIESLEPKAKGTAPETPAPESVPEGAPETIQAALNKTAALRQQCARGTLRQNLPALTAIAERFHDMGCNADEAFGAALRGTNYPVEDRAWFAEVLAQKGIVVSDEAIKRKVEGPWVDEDDQGPDDLSDFKFLPEVPSKDEQLACIAQGHIVEDWVDPEAKAPAEVHFFRNPVAGVVHKKAARTVEEFLAANPDADDIRAAAKNAPAWRPKLLTPFLAATPSAADISRAAARIPEWRDALEEQFGVTTPAKVPDTQAPIDEAILKIHDLVDEGYSDEEAYQIAIKQFNIQDRETRQRLVNQLHQEGISVPQHTAKKVDKEA